MKAELEFITPALAKQLLEQNPKNRNISQRAVDAFANDMKNGRWNNNGQTFVISESGYLLDGQHRCAAVLQSRVTISAFVVRGAPDAVFSTLDTGRSRSLADLLSIDGYMNTKKLQATAAICWAYVSGAAVTYKPTKAAAFDFIKAHPYMAHTVSETTKANKFPHSALASVVFLANENRKFDFEVSQFIDGVAHGDSLAKGDPRLTLREWYFSRSGRVGMRLKNHAIFAAVARAWSAWAKGDALSLIRIPANLRQSTLEIGGFDPALYPTVPDLSEDGVNAARDARLNRSRESPNDPQPTASA